MGAQAATSWHEVLIDDPAILDELFGKKLAEAAEALTAQKMEVARTHQ